jgi:hypothetical protein
VTLAYKPDAPSRFKLARQIWKTTTARFRLRTDAWRHAGVRFALNAKSKHAPGRFGLMIQITYAPTLGAPADGAAVNGLAAIAFTWTYNDPDGGTQNAYALRRIRATTGASEWWRASDSTWQPAETWNTTSTQGVTLPSGAWLTFGEYWSWSAATRTSGPGATSAYAPYRTLLVSSAPVPIITAPLTNLTTQSRTLSWTVPSQSRYRARLLTGGGFTTVLHDTGEVASELARSVVLAGAATGTTVRFELTVWNADGVPQVVTTDKTVTYTGPTQPTAVGSTPAGPPRARLVITNPGGGDAFASNSILRSSDGGATYAVIATGVASGATFDDFAVGAGRTYSYKVRAYGTGDTFTDSAVI